MERTAFETLIRTLLEYIKGHLTIHRKRLGAKIVSMASAIAAVNVTITTKDEYTDQKPATEAVDSNSGSTGDVGAE